MTSKFLEGWSATVYQFPARGRFAGERRAEVKPVELDAPRSFEGVCGGGWYHDAAIEESRRATEPRHR